MIKFFTFIITVLMITFAHAAVETETHTFIVCSKFGIVLAINRDSGEESYISVGKLPKSMVIHNHLGYVANEDSHDVTVIDLNTLKVKQVIPVDNSPQSISIHNGRGYVVNGGACSVSVINLPTNTVVQSIPVGLAPRSLSIYNGLGYVLNWMSHDISVIDLQTNMVTQTIPVGDEPRSLTLYRHFAYVTNDKSGTLSVLDLMKGKVISTIAVNGRPYAMSIHDRIGYIMVAGSNTISVINLSTDRIIKTIPQPKSPKSMVIHNGLGYVTYFSPSDVAVYDLKSYKIVERHANNDQHDIDFSDAHVYLGLAKILKLPEIDGVRLFNSQYSGIEESSSDLNPDVAFNRFEETVARKPYKKAKFYLDIALSQTHSKAYAVAFYAFVKGVWGAEQNDEWAKEFMGGMDHDYYLRLSHENKFPHGFILKPSSVDRVKEQTTSN